MEFQTIGVGSVANDGTGDTLRAGQIKTNENLALAQAIFNGGTSFRNKLLNGCFRVWQSADPAGSTPDDNAYCADQWRLLAESNGAATVSRSVASLQSGASARIGLVTAIADKKFGIWQPLPLTEVLPLRGRAVTFRISMSRTGSVPDDVRIGVMEWTSTADSISADPISSWGGANTNPTLAAGWAFLNTPADLGLALAAETHEVTVTVGSSANNLAVMVWSNDVTTSIGAHGLYLWNASLQIASVANEQTGFEARPLAIEEMLCKHFYQKTYSRDVVPGTNTGNGIVGTGSTGLNSAAHTPRHTHYYRPAMRIAPTVTFYTQAGTSGQWDGASSPSVVANCTEHALVEGATASGTDGRISGHLTMNARL